jgi:hypothetical protein
MALERGIQEAPDPELCDPPTEFIHSAISVRGWRGDTMAWDFETDPGDQAQLDRADQFVRDEVEPLDLVWRGKQ